MAVFYHNNLLNGSPSEQCALFIADYESARPLSDAKMAALVPFAVGRRIWWVGVTAQEAVHAGGQGLHDCGNYRQFALDAIRR